MKQYPKALTVIMGLGFYTISSYAYRHDKNMISTDDDIIDRTSLAPLSVDHDHRNVKTTIKRLDAGLQWTVLEMRRA